MKRVLFVCTGNTCRSPMAQGLMNQYAHKHGLDIQATSAGVVAEDGAPISDNAAAALSEEGIDMSYHRARQLTENDIDNANVIFCMGENHVTAVAAIYAKSMDKIFLLSGGIEDPFGGDLDMYRMCREKIRNGLKQVVETVRGLD